MRARQSSCQPRPSPSGRAATRTWRAPCSSCDRRAPSIPRSKRRGRGRPSSESRSAWTWTTRASSASSARRRPKRRRMPRLPRRLRQRRHRVVVTVAMALLLFVVLTATAYTVWFERVALGHIQRRPGPNRVGPWGLMQLAADGVKLAFKESFIPAETDKLLFVLAPAIGVAAAFLSWAVIPIGLWDYYGPKVQYWIADVNIGILLVFAFSSLNVYAIVIGGYASNNKYSLLGGLRSAAQLISYEMALGLSLVPTFMIVGSLRLRDIVDYTVHWGWYTGPIPLILLTPIGFVIYLMAAVAETNRAPFDLPEAEQELLGGFLNGDLRRKFVTDS